MGKELDEWMEFERQAKAEINRQIAEIRRERKYTMFYMGVLITLAFATLFLIIALEFKGAL